MDFKIDDKSLEKALTKEVKDSKEKARDGTNELSREEEIGYHKGSLNTLIAERTELIKMLSNVEAILQAHLKRLEELGVKIQREERR